MDSIMNEERATTSTKRAANGDGRSKKSKKAAATAADSQTSDQLAQDLVGTTLHFLQGQVRSLPSEVAKEYVSSAKEVRKLQDKIIQKTASQSKMKNQIIINGEPQPYIPTSVRVKLENLLTVPSILKDNQAPGGITSEAKQVIEGFNNGLTAILQNAGEACKKLLDLEINKLVDKVSETLFEMLFDLAIGLITTRNHNPQIVCEHPFSPGELALITSAYFIEKDVILSDDQFKSIQGNCTSRGDFVNQFVIFINKIWDDFNFNLTELKAKSTEAHQQIVLHYAGQMKEPFLQVAVGLRDERNTKEQQRNNNANLKVLYGKKNIKKKNNELAEALDSEEAQQKAVREMARAAAREEYQQIKRQDEAKQRKKSSAAGQNAQALQRTSNGRNGKEGGGREEKQKQHRSTQSRGRSPSPSTVRWSRNNSQQQYQPNQRPSSVLREGRYESPQPRQSWSNSERYSQKDGRRNGGRGRGGYNNAGQGGNRGRNYN